MLGKNIRKLRKYNNLTMNELAQKCGTASSYISDLENNKIKKPSAQKLLKIAAALEVPINELLNPTSTQEMIQNSISKKEGAESIGECFAIINNNKDEEINLLYNLLKIRYGEENININYSINNEFIELNVGDKTIIYTKQEFEKFIDHVSTLFPTFKMILDSSKTK